MTARSPSNVRRTLAAPASTDACVFPAALVADGVDGVLYKGGPTSPERTRFQRKPPHIDYALEYKVSGSHREARTTVETLAKRHRQQQRALEERFDRDAHAAKFTAQFAETRLGTCGVPTLNTVGVLVDRQRRAADAAAKRSPLNQTAQYSSSHGDSTGHRAKQIRDAVRRAVGSQTLDLKVLELIHIPPEVYTTLLLQLARVIRCVNVSRNALRDVPTAFCMAFPEVEVLVLKENALAALPSSLAALTYLLMLDAACNQLVALPLRLPTSLQKLIMSRNRLTNVPNLHLLTQLVELDLGHNHLVVPPNGLASLVKLRILLLSSNRLVTLALPLKRVEDDGASKAVASIDESDEQLDPEVEKTHWREQVDPETQATVYYHVATKTVTRAKPKCFQIQIPKLQLPGTSNSSSGTDRRVLTATELAMYPGGWEIRLGDGDATAATFVNHLASPEQPSVLTAIPLELDTLGDLSCLHTLAISNNQLLDLPPSIGKLVRLKRLEAEHNKLRALPDTLDALAALEVVKLGMNALTHLPASFTKLARLTDLDLKLNRLEVLPASFGDLHQLTTLNVSANALETLPPSFLRLTKLTTLALQHNAPLVRNGFSAATLAVGDIAQVFWQLEHQLQCERHGTEPPVPVSRVIGVGDEVWSTDIHVHRAFTKAIAEAATTTHVLDFHWQRLTLTDFPPMFFSTLSMLRELRLSGHDLDVVPSAFASLRSLRVLHLRKNRIRTLADDVFGPSIDASSGTYDNGPGLGMTELIELDIEHNAIEILPSSIGRLTKLEVLRAANNRLTHVPASIGRLATTLRELYLTHNRFTQLSDDSSADDGVSALQRLEVLDLSYNRLTALEPLDFGRLASLRRLCLSANAIATLPASLAHAPQLAELAIAGNAFTEFPASVLALSHSLTSLRMQSNKLTRLPVAFGDLVLLNDIESDGNPFASPPPEVMRLGIALIRAYLRKREARVNEIAALLTANGVAFDARYFETRKVQNLLVRPDTARLTPPTLSTHSAVDRLAFLTSQHIVTFERAVDAYINGAFYLLDVRGADLVNDLLLQTQFALAQRHRAAVLADFLALCALIKRKRWADKVDFRFDCDRPWGRNGELVGVYMLNPSIIYGNVVDDSVPSILQVIQTRVRHGFETESFTRSRAEVEDAVAHYVGVYGPVGVAHDRVPFKCGCDDLLRYNKMHAPCCRPGWTVVRVIYTAEEAARRERDDAAIADAMQALRPQIETFLSTPEGIKRFEAEVKTLKDTLRRELAVLKRKVTKAHEKLRQRQRALAQTRKDEAALHKRDPAAAAAADAQRSVAEIQARADAVDDVARLDARVRQWTSEYDAGKARLGAGYRAFLDAVVAKLLERVGAQVRDHLVRQQRERAIANGDRRPWDGRDGHAFEQYKRLVRRTMLGDGQAASESAAATPAVSDGRNATSAAAQDGETNGDDDDGASDDNSEISDVSFDGYDDLVQQQTRALDATNDEDGDEVEVDDYADDGDDERAAAVANLVVSDVSDSEDEHPSSNDNDDDDDEI